MLNITNQQENKSIPQCDVISYLSERLFTNNKLWWESGQKGTLHTVGEPVKQYNHCEKRNGDSSKD